MKLIVAVIRPEKLEQTQATLKKWDICAFSISDVHCDGEGANSMGMHRGTPYRVKQARLRVEFAVKNHIVATVVEEIVRSGYSPDDAKSGNVKIVVLPIEACALSMATDEEPPLSDGEMEGPFDTARTAHGRHVF